jgi:hypothetical protein
MSMAKLKMVTERSPERAALAEAIEAYRQARREPQACHDSTAQASERRWAAQQALDELLDERRESDLATPFLASVATGRPCEAVDLERPSVAERESEIALQREIEIWDRTREACELRIGGLQDRVVLTQRIVEVKAGEVLRPSIQPLSEKAEKFRKDFELSVGTLKFLQGGCFRNTTGTVLDRSIGVALRPIEPHTVPHMHAAFESLCSNADHAVRAALAPVFSNMSSGTSSGT